MKKNNGAPKNAKSSIVKGILGKFYLALIFVFLYTPIVALIVYSFNEGKGRKWVGFSLKWYQDLFTNSTIGEAVANTLIIALASAVIATRENVSPRFLPAEFGLPEVRPR